MIKPGDWVESYEYVSDYCLDKAKRKFYVVAPFWTSKHEWRLLDPKDGATWLRYESGLKLTKGPRVRVITHTRSDGYLFTAYSWKERDKPRKFVLHAGCRVESSFASAWKRWKATYRLEDYDTPSIKDDRKKLNAESRRILAEMAKELRIPIRGRVSTSRTTTVAKPTRSSRRSASASRALRPAKTATSRRAGTRTA